MLRCLVWRASSIILMVTSRVTSLKKCAKMDIAIVQVPKDCEHGVSVPIYNRGDEQTIAWQYTPLPMFISTMGCFKSAKLINLLIFRRVAINDGLVNHGAPLDARVPSYLFNVLPTRCFLFKFPMLQLSSVYLLLE